MFTHLLREKPSYLRTALSLAQNFSVSVFAILVAMVFVLIVVVFVVVLVVVIVVIFAAVIVIIAAAIIAAADATCRTAPRNRNVVGVKCDRPAQCKNSACNINAVSHSVTGEGDQVSHECSAGAKSSRAAHLTEHIATLGAVA